MNLTYSDYKNEYGGLLIPEALFVPLTIRAKNYINKVTKNQIDNTQYQPQLRLAVFAVAEAIIQTEGKDFLTSESVSGVSQSFDQEKIQSARFRVAKEYLSSTGLMYSGVTT